MNEFWLSSKMTRRWACSPAPSEQSAVIGWFEQRSPRTHRAAESVSSSRQLKNQLKISTRKKNALKSQTNCQDFLLEDSYVLSVAGKSKTLSDLLSSFILEGNVLGKVYLKVFFFVSTEVSPRCSVKSVREPRGSEQNTANIVNLGQTEVSRVLIVFKIYSLGCF